MKIELNVNEVLTPITHAASVLTSKNAIPIFSSLQFRKDTTHGGMFITGSNGDVWLMMKGDFVSCDVEDFCFCIEAKEILPLLRALKGQTISLVFKEESHIVEFNYKKGIMEIPYQDGMEYPKPQVDSEGVVVSIKGKDMMKALELTRCMMANDELRPILNGVHIDVTSDTMVAVATDAHRLVKTSFPVVKGVEEKKGFTIPSNAVNVLIPLLDKKGADNDEDIFLHIAKNSLFVVCGDDSMVSRLPEGKYPNYEAVIPREGHDNVLVVEKRNLMDALSRMLLMCNDKTQLIRLAVSPIMGVTLKTEDMDFSTRGSEQVDVTYNGEDMEIGFKGDYLMQSLDNIPSDKVEIKMKDATRPGVFVAHDDVEGGDGASTANYVSILMPMRVN